MTYDELVAHARKFNRRKLRPAFDPCATSYVLELVKSLEALPPRTAGDIIDSVHVGIGQAVTSYEGFFNDGEHVMEYVLALYTEHDEDSEDIDGFRMGLDPDYGDGEEFASIYDVARIYEHVEGDRACYMVRSDEEGCAVWLVFTIEPKP